MQNGSVARDAVWEADSCELNEPALYGAQIPDGDGQLKRYHTGFAWYQIWMNAEVVGNYTAVCARRRCGLSSQYSGRLLLQPGQLSLASLRGR